MQKIIRIDDLVIVTLDDGQTYQKNGITEEEFDIIINAESEEDILEIFCPKIAEIKEEIRSIEELEDRVRKSNLLEWRDDAVYFPIVSELSVPKELVQAILDAEDNNDSVLIETYRNFWTLMCLNKDEECRNNLYAFLMRHDFKIAKCGFFVGYRNVDTTREEGVYTDHHSHTFRIKIGDIVTMPREDCDCSSQNECSRGLHVSGTNWLSRNYFGNTGLVVLVNPADCVAVPERSDYGKLRTCAYLPIDIMHYNTEGKVIPYPKETGFECDLVPMVIYEGIMGTESSAAYKLEIPEIPGITRERITDNLLELAKSVIIDRNILYDSQQES
jgi:hypothetical protein